MTTERPLGIMTGRLEAHPPLRPRNRELYGLSEVVRLDTVLRQVLDIKKGDALHAWLSDPARELEPIPPYDEAKHNLRDSIMKD